MTNNKIFANYIGAKNHRADRFGKMTDCQEMSTIGVIVHDLNSYFAISALSGIKDVVAALGYELIVTHSQESVEKEVANAWLLYNARVVGVIASLSADTGNLNHFTPFTNLDVPVVFFDQVPESCDGDRVVIDNAGCGYQATEHLIMQGCKRIAIITSALWKNVYHQRYKGYRAALEKFGIPFASELLIHGDCDENAGIYATEQIMRLNPAPDGLFITNDLLAAMCMHALKKAGIRVPGDIAIAGFNNDPVGRLVFPALTTIDYPGYEMGKAAALRLVGNLTGGRPRAKSETTVIPSGLIVRNSSLKITHAIA